MDMKKIVAVLFVSAVLVNTASALDMSMMGTFLGIPPYIWSDVSPLTAFFGIVGWFFVAPMVLLKLLHWAYGKNFRHFKEFLVLAFMLNTGGFVASLMLNTVMLALASIPFLLIGYVIGLFIYAAILLMNDFIMETKKVPLWRY